VIKLSKFIVRAAMDTFFLDKEENINWRILVAEGFGNAEGSKVILSPIEVAYLIFKNRISLNPELTFEEIIKKSSENDPLFPLKLTVYVDLREKRFIARTINLGSIDFEVFERESDPLLSKSKYYVMIVPSEKSIPIRALYDALETAKNDGKILTLAIVDQDGDITYYNIESTLKFEVSLRLRRMDVISR